MPLLQTDTIGGLAAPVSSGEVTLIGGTIVENDIVGHVPLPASLAASDVQLTRRVIGGTPGVISYVWDPSLGQLTVNSDDALDTSTIRYCIRGR